MNCVPEHLMKSLVVTRMAFLRAVVAFGKFGASSVTETNFWPILSHRLSSRILGPDGGPQHQESEDNSAWSRFYLRP